MDHPEAAGAKRESSFFLYAALAANLAIAVAKFIAAALSGSSAMLSEGFHSLVDTSNEILLLHGRRRARKPPDRLHPLGYGREVYFWSFMVSLLIFATGACVSAYEGVEHLLHPRPIHDPAIGYIVLAVAFCLEGTSWVFTRRAFARSANRGNWIRAIRRSRNPPALITFLEDSAALVGIAIAAAGILLSEATRNPFYDGGASILIGLLLASLAVTLARLVKQLLIGESADSGIEDQLRRIVERQAGAGTVRGLFTIQLAPGKIFAALRLHLPPDRARRAPELIAAIHQEAAAHLPQVRQLTIEPLLHANEPAPPNAGVDAKWPRHLPGAASPAPRRPWRHRSAK